MPKADRVHSTPPTNTPIDTTRRRFLTVAAGASVASVGALTVAAMPATAPDTGACAVDPIFAPIEAHKAAYRIFEAAVLVNGELEMEIPRDRRRSSITVWETLIVETDDPRWIASERARDEGSAGEHNAAIALIKVKPATLIGARPRAVGAQDAGELRSIREAHREENAISDAQTSCASACEQTGRRPRERNVDIGSE